MTRRTTITLAASGRGVTARPKLFDLRSTTMYSMHEALARDRMREHEQRSRDARVARELAAERRWHRVSVHARAAQARHARRASRAPVR
jgi:hypothetical protein